MLKDGLFTAEDDITQALPDSRLILLLAKGASVPEAVARKFGYIKDGPVGPSEIKAAAPPVTPATEPLAAGEAADDQVLAIGSNATNPRARKNLK